MFGRQLQTSGACPDSSLVAIDGCLLFAQPDTCQAHAQAASPHNPSMLSAALSFLAPMGSTMCTEVNGNGGIVSSALFYPEDAILNLLDPGQLFNNSTGVAGTELYKTTNAQLLSHALSRQACPQQMSRLRRNAVFIPRAVSDTICQLYSTPARPTSELSKTAQHSRGKGQQQKQQKQSPMPSSRGYDSHINAVLYEWLSKNVDHPFPSQADKNELMGRTGLTKMQLKN